MINDPPSRLASVYSQAELGKDAKRISFTTSDLENLTGSYDTVLCIDVMIHYPTEKASTPPPAPPAIFCSELVCAVFRFCTQVWLL